MSTHSHLYIKIRDVRLLLFRDSQSIKTKKEIQILQTLISSSDVQHTDAHVRARYQGMCV